MITVKNLIHTYDKDIVLDDMNLTINKGDIYGFLGKNGAGKSTTLNIIAGLIPLTKGQVHLDASFGYLPEEPIFYDYMTSKEYLTYIGQLRNQKNTQRTKDLLELVKIKSNKKIHTFSRGMKQRLGLAAALYHDPEILLLDEPSSALDPEGRKNMLDTLLRLKEQGKTILLSSHILDDIEKICNRIGLMDKGRIQLETQLTDLNEYTPNTYVLTSDEPLTRHLDALNISVKEDNGHVCTIYSDAPNILATLSKLDVPIRSLQQEKLTLEDIFIRMVKSS